MSKAPESPLLVDRFGRQVNYLRISITDRCDFRCVYCMVEEMTFLPRAQILSLEEIYTLAKTFTELGVDTIRITGGEPLVRKGALELLTKIGRLPGLRELLLTTNGSQLRNLAAPLKQAGINRINISLDSLKPERFRQLTRTGDLQSVLDGINAAQSTGFERLKINSVILKDRNHDEIGDLIRFAVAQNIDISFIEEMPLGIIHHHDRAEAFYSSDLIKADIQRQFSLLPSTEKTGGPSKYFRIAGSDIRVGFISPHSHNFCASCNRVRLTVEGRLLLCLGNEHSVDLKQVLRKHPGNTALLKHTLIEAMRIKPERHHFDLHEKPVIIRHMSVTGG